MGKEEQQVEADEEEVVEDRKEEVEDEAGGGDAVMGKARWCCAKGTEYIYRAATARRGMKTGRKRATRRTRGRRSGDECYDECEKEEEVGMKFHCRTTRCWRSQPSTLTDPVSSANSRPSRPVRPNQQAVKMRNTWPCANSAIGPSPLVARHRSMTAVTLSATPSTVSPPGVGPSQIDQAGCDLCISSVVLPSYSP